MNIEDVYQLGLEQGPDIDPLLVNLLDSTKSFTFNKKLRISLLVIKRILNILSHRSSVDNAFE